MRKNLLSILILATAGAPSCGLAPGPTQLAHDLATLPFEGGKPVTVHGTASELLFPRSEGPGMLVVLEGSRKWAFSTAPNKEMARQGFRRTSLTAGEEVIVTGVTPRDGEPLRDFTPARADIITSAAGRLFERTESLTSAAPLR